MPRCDAAARHDGWYPWLITADEIPECLEYVREQPGFAERTRPFDVALPLTTLAVDEEHRPLDGDLGRAHVPTGTQATIDAVGHLLEVGVTCTSVPTPRRALARGTPRPPALGGRGDHPRVPGRLTGRSTMAIFTDPLHDEFTEMMLGMAPYGGADLGEVVAMAKQVKDGDDGSFFEVCAATAKARIAEGDAAAEADHLQTAYDCYLRAALFLGIGYHPIYGTPVDPRLVDAFHLQMETFEKALRLGVVRAETVDVPYEGTRIPAWFVRGVGHEDERRPCILVGGGWDSTMVENFLGIGVAALRRGYHVLLHDGPGQGKLLIDEGLTLRHDWEAVVTPVVDAAVGIDVVDPDRIVYEPWSLGGYMAPRVAAYEHRLAAIVADPGQIDIGGKITGPMAAMGLSADAIARSAGALGRGREGHDRLLRGQPRAALEDHPARVLDERGRRPPGLAGRDDEVEAHARGDRGDHVPRARHRRRVRPGCAGGEVALRRAAGAEGAARVHRRRGGGHALRIDQPVDGQPPHPRLARRHTGSGTQHVKFGRKRLDVSWGTLVTMQHPRHYAQTAPDRAAAIDAETGGIRTYAELDERANRFAHALREAGVHTGDHVAIVLDNRLEFFEVLWGAMNAGLYVTPVNWHLAADEVNYIVDDCGAPGARGRPAGVTDASADVGQEARALRLAVGGEVAGFDDYEAVLAAQPTGPDRRRGRRQLDVLLVRHHGPAEGHQAADDRRAARVSERVQRLGGWALRGDRGLGVPVPRAPVPLRAGRLVDDRAAPRRHRRRHAPLRRRKRASPRSSATG